MWYEQDPVGAWTKHSIASGYTEVEGIDTADVDGDGQIEIFVIDQGAGTIDVAKQDTSDPTGTWTAETLVSNAPYLNNTLVADVTGDGNATDLIYGWEGDSAGTGGLYWLEYTGGSVLDSANWATHEIAQIDGVWGIARQRVDFSDDGNQTDVVFGIRAGGRNPGSNGAVYWAEPPSNPRDPWTTHQIVDTDSVIHVDVGDLSNNGSVDDVVICHTTEGTRNGIYWYEGSNSWAEHEVTNTSPYFNVRAYPYTTGAWDLIAVRRNSSTDGDLEVWINDGGSYKPDVTKSLYKEVEKIPVADIDGDEDNEFVTVSETGAIDVWNVTLS